MEPALGAHAPVDWWIGDDLSKHVHKQIIARRAHLDGKRCAPSKHDQASDNGLPTINIFLRFGVLDYFSYIQACPKCSLPYPWDPCPPATHGPQIRHRACAHGVPRWSFWSLCSVLWFCFVWFFENGEKGGSGGYLTMARPWLVAPRTLQDALFFLNHFFDAFLDRFLIDLGSMFPPNLPPKSDKNALKIDAKRHPILGFKF